MYHTRAFDFPEAVAYGRLGGKRVAEIQQETLVALSKGQTVITATPRKGGGLHLCTIYPFRQKRQPTPLLQWR